MDDIDKTRRETKSYMFEMTAYFKRKELYYAAGVAPSEHRAGETASLVDVETKPLN